MMCRKLKEKDFPIYKKEARNFLVDAGLSVIGKKY